MRRWQQDSMHMSSNAVYVNTGQQKKMFQHPYCQTKLFYYMLRLLDLVTLNTAKLIYNDLKLRHVMLT